MIDLKCSGVFMIDLKSEDYLLSCLLNGTYKKNVFFKGVSVIMEKLFPEWIAVLTAAALLGMIAEVKFTMLIYLCSYISINYSLIHFLKYCLNLKFT